MRIEKNYIWGTGYWTLSVNDRHVHFWHEFQCDRIIRKLRKTK